MESPMLKSKNPDKERPSKHQKRWTYEEETLLLEFNVTVPLEPTPITLPSPFAQTCSPK